MISVKRFGDDSDVYRDLRILNPDALVAKGFEDAYIGYTSNPDCVIAVYDYELCVQIICVENDMNQDDAIDYLEGHTIQSCYGLEYAPLFVVTGERG